ncbi:MAG: hypothetical protein QM750_23675 [Rubrivivax sp.]
MTAVPGPARPPVITTTDRRTTPWAWGAALLVLAVGAWLRLDQLLDQTLVDDEWHAVHQLIRSRPGQFMLSLGRDDYSIPLTALDWLQLQTVGLTEIGMRLPLLLAGLASLIVLPWALAGSGAQRLDRRTQLVFALLLAVSTLMVGYSRMARPYALTLLLTLTAFALLARAGAGPRLRWGPAAGYAGLAALSVWLHAVTAPFVVAPLLALGWAGLRGRGLRQRDWLALAALAGALIALAVLPPLLADTAAMAGKSGKDWPRWSTLRGVWYVWLGSSSTAVVLISLALAAVGAGAVWRSGPVARWTLLGLGLTVLTVLLVRPAWVFNPLTFGRYLLPALPLLLLAVAAGVVRVADEAAGRLQGAGAAPALRWILALGLGATLAAATWWHSPQPQLVRHPNSHTLHYYYQFDFRPRHNPVVPLFDAAPLSPFWAGLATQPAGSLTVAAAPFRFESPAWLGPIWERASHQRVVPAFLSGSCVPWLQGEVPADARFRLRNGVHLLQPRAALARQVDYVAFERRTQVLGADGRWHLVPECEAWLRRHLGAPDVEDAGLLVWQLKQAPR